MKRSAVVSIVLCAMMVSAGALSKHLTPTMRLSKVASFDLATMVPASFGDWTVDASLVPVQVDPETQAKIDSVYTQTLSRTYVNGDGARVMLSLAYGGDQSDHMTVHRPEVCYAAQGFEVRAEPQSDLQTSFGALPVKRLFAVNGNRNEPITYWITVGNKATRPGVGQRLEQLRYGLTGVVPDGMLVRVSTIGTDIPAAYRTQDHFVAELLKAMGEKGRVRLAGVFDPAAH